MAQLLKTTCTFVEDLTPNELAMVQMGVKIDQVEQVGAVVFDVHEVSNFNESSKGETTVSLKNGERFTVGIPINGFYAIMQKYVGEIIEARVI